MHDGELKLSAVTEVSGRRAAVNAAASYGGHAVHLAVGLLLTAYVIRTLGKAEYSLWPLTTTCMALVALLPSGVGRGVGRFLAHALGRGDVDEVERITTSVFAALVATAGLYAVCVVVLSLFFERIFDIPPQAVGVGPWAMALVGLAGAVRIPFGVFEAGLIAGQCLVAHNAIRAVSFVARAGLTVLAFTVCTPSLIWVAAVFLVVQTASALATYAVARRRIPWLRLRWRSFGWGVLRSVSGFSAWALVFAIAGLLHWKTDNVVINKEWTGERPVAHRAAAYGVNRDTFLALRRVGIPVDSPIFHGHPNSRVTPTRNRVTDIEGVIEIPVTLLQRAREVRLANWPIRRRVATVKTDVDWASLTELRAFVAEAKAHGIRVMSLFEHFGDAGYLDIARDAAQWLLDNVCQGCEGYGWGHSFDWRSRMLMPRNTPTGIVSAICGEGFWRLYQCTGEARYLECCRRVCEGFLRDLNIDQVADGAICFSYSALDRFHVHNVNLWIAAFLVKLGLHLGIEEYVERGLAASRYALLEQRDDGSLPYWGTDQDDDGVQDHYHSGFEIRAFHSLWKLTQDRAYHRAATRLHAFYLEHFFGPEGQPWRAIRYLLGRMGVDVRGQRGLRLARSDKGHRAVAQADGVRADPGLSPMAPWRVPGSAPVRADRRRVP